MLSKEQVKHIGELARLDLTEQEVKKFQKELSSVLDYVSQLQEIDTQNIKPTFQTTALKNALRKDQVREEQQLTQEQALSNAPQKEQGQFKVKLVLTRQ